MERTFKATVRDAGGGIVDLLVDRDTDQYPPEGTQVRVYYAAPSHRVVSNVRGILNVVDFRRGGSGVTVATFNGPDAERYAREHADRLNASA